MFRRMLPLGLIAVFLSGCGDDLGYRFPLQPASGKVLYQSKPVAKAIVRFHPTDAATTKVPDGKTGPPVMLTSETDDNGEFSMSTYVADDGIPAGDYVVTVAMGLADSEIEGGDGKPSKVDLEAGKIYRYKNTTTLKATVKPGENKFTFELN